MNDKENQIEEMAKTIVDCGMSDCVYCNGKHKCIYHKSAELLYNAGYRKLPDGAVVLTEGEYSDILSDEIQTIERDVAEFWANANFDKVVKGLHNLGYRKLDDHAIVSLRKAHGIENKIRKETAREILQELFVFFRKDKQFTTISRATILSLAKQFGVEVEE